MTKVETYDKVTSTSDEEVMTAAEVADFLKVSVSAVRRWSRTKKLKGYRLGGRGDWRYLKTNVLDFLYGLDS